MFLINQIFVILILIIDFWLGIWVYLINPKNRINQLFSLMMASIFLWVFSGWSFDFFSYNEKISLFFVKLRFEAVVVFAISAYLFSLFFPRKEKNYPILTSAVFLWGIINFFISIFSDLVIRGIQVKEWGVNIIFGKGSLFFFGGMVLLTFLILYILFKKYYIISKEEKLQIQYFLIGVLIFVAGNLIFNVFQPIFFENYKYYQLGDYSSIFLLGFTAYAILNKKLFGIRVVLTQILVSLMGIVLAIVPFFMPSTALKIGAAIVFAVYCFIGYLLIKSSLREINAKELLEQKVQERTKDLQLSKEELEQSKKIAEERAAELEKWYKLTIGREVRMAELKEKIKEMEEKTK